MEKMLVIETSAFRGKGGGGSFLQARYYADLLGRRGYSTQIFFGEAKSNQYLQKARLIHKIRASDMIIGFGTPLLCSYLQWLCFLTGKKGIFCIDTYISSHDIIKDHLKRSMFPTKIILYTAFSSFLNKIFLLLLPPKLNLVTLFSCRYIRSKLKHTRLASETNRFLYPKINFKKRDIVVNKQKSVLFYGTLYRGRGVRDVIQACKILWSENFEFKLVILGWPIDFSTKEYVMDDIRNIDKSKLVLKGFVPHIKDYLHQASVVVLPFRYPCSFQTPYTLLEPMGLGIPVITTDVGSHREWVRDQTTGLFCKKENSADIAEKIKSVFTNKKLVDKITAGAYSLLKNKYHEKDLLIETLIQLENER